MALPLKNNTALAVNRPGKSYKHCPVCSIKIHPSPDFIGFLWIGQQDRGIKTVHIEWKRPEKVHSVEPKSSGDLEPLPKLDENTIFEDFKHVNIDEYVRT